MTAMWHDEAGSLPAWSLTHCRGCHGLAWRARDGEVFCGTCEDRAARREAMLAGSGGWIVFRSLRAALLASTHLALPRAA